MQNSMMGWGEIALRQAQASKEARERRRAAHDNIEVDGGSKRDKTAASRRINTEIREKYSVERLNIGERIQIASPAGAGKTTYIADMIKAHPELMDLRLWIMEPTHEKADEVVTDLAKRGIEAIAIRGRGAPNPEDPDEDMCVRSAVTDRVARAGLPVEEVVCAACPLRERCAYQDQKTEAAGIYVMSHEYLTVPKSPAGTPDILIVDETHHAVVTATPELSFDRLSQVIPWRHGMLGDAIQFRETATKVRTAIEDHPEDILEAVRAVVDLDDIKDARKHLSDIEDRTKTKISGGMRDKDIMEVLDQHVRLDIHTVAKMFSILANEYGEDRKQANGISVVARGGNERRIKLHYLKPLASVSKAVPVMVLDASADIEINRRIWGDIRDETARITRNCHVTQVSSRNFSRSSLIGIHDGDEAAATLRDQTREVLKRIAQRHDRVLAVSYMDLDDAWGIDGVHSAHFGALRGLNAYEASDAVVVIGREQPLAQAEAMARAIYASDAEPIMTLDHGSWRDGKTYMQTRRYRRRQ